MNQNLLDEIIGRINGLPESEKQALIEKTVGQYSSYRWIPLPGPQTEAYDCLADEVFYGGQAGGGKSSLITGLAVNEHERSLILRRMRDDAKDLAEQELINEILGGDRSGWNGQDLIYRFKDKTIEYGGCKDMEDRQRYKGKPHDLISFDEITDFLKAQYEFIIAWNRSTTPGQRCRVVCTGNPPTRAEGLWVIEYWAPWLDPTYANPAEPGELRYFITDDAGRQVEVDGPGPHMIDGLEVHARSRTFIPAELSDNTYLAQDGKYKTILDGLPKPLRDAYRDGRFDVSLKDHPFQMIPTEWVRAAQARWTERPPANVPLCAIALDPAQGGADDNVVAKRHDAWFDKLIEVPGIETPVGTDMAAVLVKHRKQGAVIVIDCGGGYGNSAYMHLKEQDMPQGSLVAYKGSEASTRRSADKLLKFHNKRTETYWLFREALDPESGVEMALPPDQELLADLTTPTFEVVAKNTVKMEPKTKVVDRLGRSPGKGDAVVMCWSAGSKAITHASAWLNTHVNMNEMGINRQSRRPKVEMGHKAVRRNRR